MNYNTFIIVLSWLISYCLCEITENTKVKLLTDFINYYNQQPNHNHQASDGYLQSVREIDFTTFRIDVSFGFNKNDKRARMKCSATVKDIGEKGIALVNNDMYCSEVQLIPNAEDVSVESVEDQASRPVKLENEVQSDTALTSGEQFIAIPRDQPTAPCIGCSSHVNPQAAGVKDLVNLGIRQLNLHEPTVKHSLESVIDVERQVQVVNGVRYNLILLINFNNCSEVNTGTDFCSSTKTCKISILVKPWQTLPSGSKYRSILSNNCTEEWLFGDNGEVLPELTDNSDHKERDDNTSSDIDDIKVERHEDSQSQPNQERTLTIEEIKALEEQILPHDSAHHYSNGNKNIENLSPGSAEISKEHVVKAETNQQFTNNNVDVTDSSKKETADINQDKKKVIDEMLDFLNFSGFKARPQQPTEEMIPRVKRSYDYDLQILSLTEKFRDLKKSIENAKYIYEMAQAMVDYLNEIDMAIKNRAVKNVLKAEEEEENDKRFVYIQAQVVIPCDTVNCDAKKTQTKICNGVIDSTNKNNPQILNTFCHVDTKEIEMQENVKEVSSHDPVLLRLTKEVLRKIESESTDSHAVKIKKIVAANTRVVSGRVTKISMVIERINCNKSVPMALRTNCSTLQDLGSNICEVIVHEKHWLKEKKISYTCTERPIDMTISKRKQDDKSDDPKIVELLEEALHYLEVESDKKYKQKIVKVSNITTQIITGFLINIEFVVGYTNCTHAEDFKAESGKCELLTTERLRKCKAQVWDRLWIVDGRQMEVTCDENTNKRKELDIIRKKRSLDLFGGDTVQNVDNPEYQKLAEESLQNYLNTSSSQQHYEIIKIERVTVEVVSGKKTKIKFIISPTDCNITSDGSVSLSQCKVVNTDNMINCDSTILEQSWTNNKQYSVQCDMYSNGSRPKSKTGGLKKLIYGGIKNQDQSDPKFQILAEESLQKYIQLSGSYQPFKIIKIENVTTQIVQGLLTRIEFIATDGKETQITCYSKVWEQERLNKKDIDVSCQSGNQGVKRQLVGGSAEADPKNPKYVQLSNESLQKYLFSTGNAKKHAVIRINKVSTQVVSGSLTKIDFDVKEIGKSNDDTLNCHSEIWERPWLDKKDITVSCQSSNQRLKTQLVDGPAEADPKNPKYVQLANESLQKYLFSTGNAKKHAVVRINKVSTQVVSGSLTKIDFDVKEIGKSNDDTLNCHSEIWERPWLGKKDITVSCHNGNQKEERQLIGAPTKQDPTDLKYIQLAGDSLQKYLTLTSNPRPHKVVRIKSVTTQLVSGLLTRIDFVATESDIPSGEIITCFSKIWEQEWQDKKDIDVSCQSTHRKYKRNDLSEKNPNDPKYLQLADESLKQYLLNTGNEQPHKVVRVKKVNIQLISGLLTRLNFVALPTDTTRSDVINCYSEVLEQPWHDKKDIKVSCQYDNHGMKKEIAGRIIKRDPNAAKYLKLAEESFKKYLSDTGNQHPYKVVRIDQVTTQISVGYLTRINFVVTSNITNAIMNCFSEIWEQADKTKLNVECENDISSRQKRDLQQARFKNKNYDTEQDVTKPQFQLLAAQALRKYSQRKGILHKIVGVKRVTMRVVAGMIYKIDFSASPTECLFNVSNAREYSCKLIANSTLYCHTEIWDQPWIRKKKIDIECSKGVENDYDDYRDNESEETGNRKNRTTESNHATKLENAKVYALAEEAIEDFLSSSNRKYVFRITEMHSFNEYMADSVISKLEFSIAPTLCLRDAFLDMSHSCEFKKPLTEYYCKAKIVEQSWLESEKDIKIQCKKQNNKTESVKRSKRQIGRNMEEDDNEVDEETAYYYADRAVHQLNERTDAYNLYKLITIHSVQSTMQMKAILVKMFIEVAETYCLRQNRNFNTIECEEMEGINHRICLAKIYPSTDDELVVKHVIITCDDDDNQFNSVSGLYVPELLRLSIGELEKDPQRPFKLVHQGEPQVIPSLDNRTPVILNFVVAITNCSVNVDLTTNPFQCYLDYAVPSKSCTSKIWLDIESRTISNIEASCNPFGRKKRAILDTVNITADDSELNRFMKATIEKLEMSSMHRYKQRVLHINSYSSKITSGRVTTIDFDVAYTSCLKYEWVANVTSCDFLEHLPRRHCVAQIWERLWINNGMNIDVSCEDDETPLEAHVEFESAEMANQLAQESLKHIEAKYPNSQKQKVVRIFSLEKQVVAGVHYRMKMEIGTTDCVALSDQTNCKLNTVTAVNKFCRVNVWLRPWTDHPPNFRVTCDYQEGASMDFYRQLQAEHLFINFVATYNPNYGNDHHEMAKRFEIFKANVRKIHEFNVYEKGTAKYGVTRFADLTYKEFSSRYMGLKPSLRKNNQPPIQKADIPSIKMPLSFDWREYNAVTDVKDQGDCGVSWAFSVTGNIESQWKIKSEKLLTLSEQQLLDCDKVNEGCSGGLPENAYRAIEEMGGMQSDLEYPYEDGVDTCLFNKTRAKVRISGAVNITSNETGMAQWLLYNGPISIGMNGQAMQFYMGGIAYPWHSFCNETKLDHAALIVGYGEHEYPVFHKKIRYWIVKNSWGETWGEKGYYRIQRGGGTCGVNRMATSAVIAN